MSDNITLPREVAEKALSMLDLLGLPGDNVADRIHAALAEPTVKDSLTAQESLRQENDRLREAWKLLRAEVERLREALKRHGMHNADCFLRGECNCGLDAALRQEDIT